jgi:2-keto-4-pentenoate hydratase/2-oxohepta-3-ene-1,7-dioic acid hydratase in catechol pathway
VSAPTTPFSLGRFSGTAGAFTGVVVDDVAVPISACGVRIEDDAEPAAVLGRWAEVGESLMSVAQVVHEAGGASEAVPVTALQRLVPVRPRQVFAAGLNYRKHVIDLMVDQRVGSRPGVDVEEIRAETTAMMDERARSGVPYVFVVLPSALCGADDDIVLRPDSDRTDWELELAAVIARPARNLSREEALSCVGGWTIANDLTARDFVARSDVGPVSVDWLRSKCSPTYKPVGPYVVPAAFVEDPQDLRIELRLNGDVMQDETTADMLFDVAALLSYVSHEAQLLPGDIMLTGSPAGNGSHYDRWLRPGDVMEGFITGLGTQHNRCVAARAA